MAAPSWLGLGRAFCSELISKLRGAAKLLSQVPGRGGFDEFRIFKQCVLKYELRCPRQPLSDFRADYSAYRDIDRAIV